MHDFTYKEEELYCEEVPIREIARQEGTPLYVYSHRTLRNHFLAFDGAFQAVPHITCFAVKANSNLAVLRIFAREGGGADVVSGGELYRALRAGIDPKRIVYAGVGKRADEMRYALEAGILAFNVESSQEISSLNDVAKGMGIKASVALRVNPDVDPQTHPYIATGLKKSKFGIDISIALNEYKLARSMSNIEVIGVHIHIGSQITQATPYVEAVSKLVPLVEVLRNEGLDIRFLDVGGGLGITYRDENPPHPRDLALAMTPLLEKVGCTILFEPGRVIVGNAGILVTRVLYTKSTSTKNFVIVDAGMNDLIRPSIYGSYQEIIPVERDGRGGEMVSDVVGPICEEGDFLARERTMPAVEQGQLLAVMSAGAYGFTMSSNYNSRPRAAEVLVSGGGYSVIRRREVYDDLVRGEEIPEFLA